MCAAPLLKQPAVLWPEGFEMLLTEGDWKFLKSFNYTSIRGSISKTEINSQDGFTDDNAVSFWCSGQILPSHKS